MITLHSNKDLFFKIKDFIGSSENFTLFVPYIQARFLSELLESYKGNPTQTIVTSWKPQDIALGISDIEVFPYCRDNGITLLVNNRIHLKAYAINNYDSCIITSSNISGKGLAIDQNYNYEMGVIVNELEIEDKIYFDQIIEASVKVKQEYYDQAKNQIESIELKKEMIESFEFRFEDKTKYFLLTALPMSEDVKTLYSVYQGDYGDFSEEVIRSAEHDIRLYGIPRKKSKSEFERFLKSSYFSHPFIKAFLDFNCAGKHFGELSSWLHNSCSTVPTPRRFEIKEALQRIFSFTVTLSNGVYRIEIPYEHSQVLKKKNK